MEKDFREVICGVPTTLQDYEGRLEQNNMYNIKFIHKVTIEFKERQDGFILTATPIFAQIPTARYS